MTPSYIATEIGRTISTTFHVMQKNGIPFDTCHQDGYLTARIPGFLCPTCKKFTPGEDLTECGFEKEHRFR